MNYFGTLINILLHIGKSAGLKHLLQIFRCLIAFWWLLPEIVDIEAPHFWPSQPLPLGKFSFKSFLWLGGEFTGDLIAAGGKSAKNWGDRKMEPLKFASSPQKDLEEWDFLFLVLVKVGFTTYIETLLYIWVKFKFLWMGVWVLDLMFCQQM